MIKGDSCKYIASLHEKYGEVVRTGPNEISYMTASANKTIFGNKTTEDRAFEKNPAVYIQGSGAAQNILFASTREHPRYKKLMAPAFSEQAIKEQEPMIQEYTSLMIDALRHNRSGEAYYPDENGVVNMGAWVNFIIFDILSALSFGKPVGCLPSADYHPWAYVIFGAMKHSHFVQCAHRLKPYHPLLEKLIPGDISIPYQTHMENARKRLREREQDKSISRADFASFILKGMTEDELLDNINILATAGSETTATTISSVLYYLAHNPEVYQKLVSEIRSSYSSEEEITFNSVSGLGYLKAVIQETFRIHPSVPVGLHRITPKSGSYIDGNWVPGGVWLALPKKAKRR
jgi:cytochrome P450